MSKCDFCWCFMLQFKELFINVRLISKLQQLAFEGAEWVIRVGWKRTERAAAKAEECRASEWNRVKKTKLKQSQCWQPICWLCALSSLLSPPFSFASTALEHVGKRDIHPSLKSRVGSAQSPDRPQKKTPCAAVSANQKGVLSRDYLEWPCVD